jgi:hypothetical protein
VQEGWGEEDFLDGYQGLEEEKYKVVAVELLYLGDILRMLE